MNKFFPKIRYVIEAIIFVIITIAIIIASIKWTDKNLLNKNKPTEVDVNYFILEEFRKSGKLKIEIRIGTSDIGCDKISEKCYYLK